MTEQHLRERQNSAPPPWECKCDNACCKGDTALPRSTVYTTMYDPSKNCSEHCQCKELRKVEGKATEAFGGYKEAL